ncbi:MAG: selenide, water dikinase SelD [Vicinamibacterales bacterium]|jgi:selenide,water dikinase|nr:selenide, water dikinase SelD [Vicinamibacterales bacterium]
MRETTVPVVKDLVLIGGGHTHVAVLKRFGMRPVPGVRLTVIARDVHTPYSGMLPGLVAGHYEFDDIHIDLAPLSRFTGARLFHQSVVGLDLDRRIVRCDGRPPVPYDLLSINIGSTPSLREVPGAAGVVVPVKPISTFVERWQRLRARVTEATGLVRIGVVGAGAGGVELTLSAQFALHCMLEALGRPAGAAEFHLFGAGETILATHNRGMRRRLERVLRERGVHMHLGQTVASVSPGLITCSDGTTVALDEILWVTQAGAAPWLGEAGLEVDEQGFVRVDDTLQSVSHPGVFAAGDAAAVVNHPREKAGVFAVRQGAPLADNLRRVLVGRAPRPFRPQRRFLTLVSTGGRHAVGSRGPWSFEGDAVWRWKDWIDRRFMARYSQLPVMAPGSAPAVEPGLASPEVLKEISTAAMRCGGCGSKVGATPLERVLDQLRPVRRDDVLIGLESPDDAAVVTVPPGKVQVRTVDAFRAIVNDPFVFGQITANHCLGDIFAMGAEAQSALAVATVPFGLDTKVEDMLVQLLTGAVGVLNDAGAALVGGHTSEGADLALGLSLTGLADPDALLRKSGLRPGDRLVLTKGIGTGTLFAAEMRMRAKGRWIDGAIQAMRQSSRAAAAALRRHGATACTDVTGFGLLGHLVEMTRASGVDARLALSSVPVLDGALETSGAGLLSSLHPHNVRLRRAVADVERAATDPRYSLLYDPQTAGGLLAGVPADRADACVADLHAQGYEQADVIGSVELRGDAAPIHVE